MNLSELRHIISEIISEEVGDFKDAYYDDKFYPDFDPKSKTNPWNFDKVRNMLSKLKSLEGQDDKRAEHVKELSADAGAIQRWCEQTLSKKKDSGLKTKQIYRDVGGAAKGKGMGSMSSNLMSISPIRRNF